MKVKSINNILIYCNTPDLAKEISNKYRTIANKKNNKELLVLSKIIDIHRRKLLSQSIEEWGEVQIYLKQIVNELSKICDKKEILFLK